MFIFGLVIGIIIGIVVGGMGMYFYLDFIRPKQS